MTKGNIDFVGVKPSASQDDINKAYRKKAKLLHPDKAKQSFVASKAKATPTPKLGQKKKPGVHVNKAPSEREIRNALKEASDRFARLGLIASILRGPGRERYDHFVKNGFPKWRGTGYYYARFRPGLTSVLLGLFVFGGGLAHYGVLVMSWNRQREFLDRYVRQAKKDAWGDELGIRGVPGIDDTGNVNPPPTATGQDAGNMVLNRKERRQQERESKKGKENKRSRSARRSGTSTPLGPGNTDSNPQGEKRRVQAENGKILIVDSVGNVFLEEESEDGEKREFLLDPNEIAKPTFQQTVLFRLPVWLYRTLEGRIRGRSIEDQDATIEEEDSSDAEQVEKVTRSKKSTASGNAVRAGKRNGKTK